MRIVTVTFQAADGKTDHRIYEAYAIKVERRRQFDVVMAVSDWSEMIRGQYRTLGMFPEGRISVVDFGWRPDDETEEEKK